MNSNSDFIPSDDVWAELDPKHRDYFEHLPDYHRLCNEVEHILRIEVKQHVASISSRVKTFESYSRKLKEKEQARDENPINDLAGVRLVYLFKEDGSEIDLIVQRNFEVVERQDKREKPPEEHSYSGVHYLVRLKNSGPRYAGLKDYVCEIQVRTLGEDAWAMVDRILIYKHTPTPPNGLKHHMYGLVTVFEKADQQIQDIKDEHETWIRSQGLHILKEPLSRDSFEKYLNYKFHHLKPSDPTLVDEAFVIFEARADYKTIKALNNSVDKGEKLLHDYFSGSRGKNTKNALAVLLAAGIANAALLQDENFPVFARKLISDLTSL